MVGADNEEIIFVGKVFKIRKIKTRSYVQIFKVLEFRYANCIAKTQKLNIIFALFTNYELSARFSAFFGK